MNYCYYRIKVFDIKLIITQMTESKTPYNELKQNDTSAKDTDDGAIVAITLQ